MEPSRRLKSYQGFRIQPYRKTKEIRGSMVQGLTCLTVGAFNIFKDYACMSLETADIDIEPATHSGVFIGSVGNTKYHANIDKNGVFGKFFDFKKSCRHYRYVLIRVNIPGHIIILLWDRLTNEMELFDSGGIGPFIQLIEDIIWLIFEGAPVIHDYYLVPDVNFGISSTDPNNIYIPKILFGLHEQPDIIMVNQKALQVLPEDIYCQTWIYYYIYMRLISKVSRDDLIILLNETPDKEKLSLIEDFWDFLIKQ